MAVVSSTYSADDWRRLGRLVKRRRELLGLRQEDVAEAAEIAVGTVRNVETGNRARGVNLGGISRALGWEEQSCHLILEGGDPIIAEPVEDEPDDPDALHVSRPAGIPEAQWEDMKRVLIANLEAMLRMRGN